MSNPFHSRQDSLPHSHGMKLAAMMLLAIAVVAGAALMIGNKHAGNSTARNLPTANQASLRPASLQSALPSTPAITPATRARINATYAALPLAFEVNQGQVDPQVKYLARGNGYKLYLTSSQAVMTVSRGTRDSEVRDMIMNKRRGPAKIRKLLMERTRKTVHPSSTATLRMNFVGANPSAQLTAHDQQAGRVNYFIGNDPAKWHSNIPLFARVSYRDLYPGVDLAFHGVASQLEFDYVVSPGANPKVIALGFQGAEQVNTTPAGDLILTTEAGPVQIHKPVAYQEKDGLRHLVDARFTLKNDNRVAFALGPYDSSRQLVIDPTVTYSTYFGGNLADYGLAITVDSSGNAFVAGATDSPSIPGFGTATNAGSFDAFVTEITPTGTLVFTTEFGGGSDEFPGGIAVDTAGNIYITGTTDSVNFPVTTGAAQTTFQGGTTSGNNDAFAVKLTSTGAITWGTYIGGNDSDSGLGIALDSSSPPNVFIVGETFSTNLPVVNALPNGGALNLGLATGIDDGYLVELNSTGSTFLTVSYVGGSNGDLATGVSVDGGGNVYISGSTISTDLKTTSGVVQPACGTDGTCNTGASGPQDDAFIASVKPTPIGYNYLTYYGGSGADDALGIATDSAGNAFLTGSTVSTDFPTHGTPFQNALAGTENAFVLELNSSGSASTYASYLGGSGSDLGLGVAVDTSDNAYVIGQASSTDFPTLNPTQAQSGGATDAFVSVLSTSQGLLFSTYLGGGGDENQLGGAIALGSSQDIYVTGDTDSGNGTTSAFPLKNPLPPGTYGGGTCSNGTTNVPCPDAFIAAYSPATAADFSVTATALSPASIADGASATSTITVTALNGYTGTVNLTCNVTGGGSPAPKCTLSSTSTKGSGSSTLTIHAIGASGALFRHTSIFYASWLPMIGLSLIGMRFSSKHSRRRKLVGFLLLGIVMTTLFFLPACGSSSHNPPPPPPCTGCTPSGNYTINVTGTDSVNANLTHPLSPPLALTVQ